MDKNAQQVYGRTNNFGLFPSLMGQSNVFVYPVPAHDYVIYIDDLSWLEDHQERLQIIRQATPDDSIRIILNTPGGVVNIAMAYINAMAESSAHIVTHAEGQVCSAGTVLWLAGEERTVSPLTIFMFHNYQGGAVGDGANMHSQIIFEKEYFDRMYTRFYKGILTEEELMKISCGGQVWMDEVQILDRTEALLLDTKNIRRMQSGRPPLKQKKKGDETKTEPEKEGVVTLRLAAEGKELLFDASNIQDKDMEPFSEEGLFSVIEQLVELVEGEGVSEVTVTELSSREDLLAALRVTSGEVAKIILERQGQQ